MYREKKRLTDVSVDGRLGTATLIDNIWTNNVESRMESGLVTVRISDHLPVFVFIGGERRVDGGCERVGKRRRVNEARIDGLI